MALLRRQYPFASASHADQRRSEDGNGCTFCILLALCTFCSLHTLCILLTPCIFHTLCTLRTFGTLPLNPLHPHTLHILFCRPMRICVYTCMPCTGASLFAEHVLPELPVQARQNSCRVICNFLATLSICKITLFLISCSTKSWPVKPP